VTARASRAIRYAQRFALAFACVPLTLGSDVVAARAAIPPAQRSILTRFLRALHAQNYPAAYALLSKPERSYFGSASNYASSYLADRIKLDSYRLVATTQTAQGTIAIVSERLEVFSPRLQTSGSVTSKFAYGIVTVGGELGIKDPYHPWRALVPANWSTTASGVTVIVRKLSFYTGRIELLLTFQNRSDVTVTLLPYGRSVVRDSEGGVHHPIETKLAGLTDAELYKGVRLAPGSQFTGAMTFFTSDRFMPAALSATIAPLLADGADDPFALELPDFPIPR
jgi:hypothetical protein